MKTTSTKTGLACLAALMASGSVYGEITGNSEFAGFVKRIECREGAKDPNIRILHKDPTERLKKNAQRTPSRFTGWNEADPSMPTLMAKAPEAGEQMDSIVGTFLDGRPMSMQKFSFTETGLPLECRNYLPALDGDSYAYSGHFEYEYDAQGRVTSAENIDLANIGSCQRMEYIYDGNSRSYNVQIAYLMSATEEDWIPYQKGEYAFDENGNTIEETFFSWDDVNGNWKPAQKTTATYNEMNWMTSYYPYTWDEQTNAWVGTTETTLNGKRYEYTQDGNDALIAEAVWYDGAWLEYHRYVFHYNDAALLIQKDDDYWNRQKQDWSGAETWGQWERMYYNSRQMYDYDEYGRIIETNIATAKSGEYVNYYREIKSYEPLDNGDTEIITEKGSVASDGTYEPTDRNIQHINKFGSENYYISYRNNNGKLEPTQEEIRYLDDYNWFLGGDYYSFFNGERKPTSKEWFTYPDDFDPTLGYETPIEGRHWVGIGVGENAEWKLKHVDSFTWGPRDVMTGYINYDYLMSDGNKTQGWDRIIDFEADMTNTFIWPDANKVAAYYENKFLETITYINPQYWNGVNEWDDNVSYKFTYYYSPRTTSGVDSAEPTDGTVETERFDLMGRRLEAPTRGINIVRYSNGTSRKVMVK